MANATPPVRAALLVARVRVLERGFREGALCIRDPDRGEHVIFIRMGVAVERGVGHVTATRRPTDGPDEKCGRHTFANEIRPQGGVTTHTLRVNGKGPEGRNRIS